MNSSIQKNEEEELIELIKKIDTDLSQVKTDCSHLYKSVEKSNEEDNTNLISTYNSLIAFLKNIKEESRKLDSIEVPRQIFESEDTLRELRERNCKIIQSLAQHIRGCIASLKKYHNILDNK